MTVAKLIQALRAIESEHGSNLEVFYIIPSSEDNEIEYNEPVDYIGIEYTHDHTKTVVLS